MTRTGLFSGEIKPGKTLQGCPGALELLMDV